MAEAPRKRAEILACPACGNDVGVTLSEAARIEPCPHCGQPMILPSVDGSFEVPDAPFVIDDEPDAEDDAAAMERLRQEREQRLNALRVAALTAERRALHRRWTFAIGLGVVLAVGAVHGVLLIFRNNDEPTQRLVAVAVLSVGALYFAIRSFRRAAALSRELKRPMQTDPDAEPDFTPLSDGSQQWKNLEKM